MFMYIETIATPLLVVHYQGVAATYYMFTSNH
jgi:hypothetical protein